jgi:hypothetical protein
VGNEVKAKVDALPQHRDINVKMGGDLENQKNSFSSLGLALLMSLVLSYLIMVALYDNFIDPFIVMSLHSCCYHRCISNACPGIAKHEYIFHVGYDYAYRACN